MFAVDLRSDTVTVPTAEMREAMARAEVGDDVYAEDPTVNRLQDLAAEMIGFEGALFVPSGTMSNQIALAVHVRRGSEVIVPMGAHVYEYEPGAMAVISGALPRLVEAPRGAPTPGGVRAAIRRSGHQAPTGLVVLENTHNLAGGAVVPLATVAAIQAVAAEEGLPTHLDGARAFNAAAALGVTIADVTRGFDSVSICLSKGLGAPVGSLLLGSNAFLQEAHRYRKLLGGGMRQAGVLAAAGMIALTRMPQLLPADHARARRLAEALATTPGIGIDMGSVQTNMVYATVADSAALVKRCAARGVGVGAMGPTTVRLVTHHQVNDADLELATQVVTEEARALAAAA
ncbi:MAG: GntG family PLP-dependent aldolase [Trueperaceae bacterium]|jgi:threonine aldolase|nr:GntG family PLP-dependent aldolase [Truepera sp.]